jgi:hypothetical protein
MNGMEITSRLRWERRFGNANAGRSIAVVITGVTLILIACELYVGMSAKHWRAELNDWDVVAGAAQRWIHGGSYFLDRQVHGPYPWMDGDVFYPPTALLLFVPFSFLPPLAWMVAPAIVMGMALRRLRPALWTWPVIALLLVPPQPLVEVLSGNPLIWVMAALFATAAWGSPASLVLLKPTLLPFAFLRANTRAWMLGVVILAVPSLLLLPLNLEWLHVVLDARGGGGFLHNLMEIPYALIPLVAWAGSASRGRGSFVAGA